MRNKRNNAAVLQCALNGEGLHAVDPRIYIQDIKEQVRMTVSTAVRPVFGGTLMNTPERESLAVTVRFMVKESDLQDRQLVIQRVNGWAKEGWLTISTRPDQRLYVVCTQPAGHETFKWHADMELTFTAYDGACWQDIYPASCNGNGKSLNLVLATRGTRQCYLEAKIANTSANTVNSLSLSANGKTIAFAGLNLPSGKTLELRYDERRMLGAFIDNTGKLSCRTAASADDIVLRPTWGNGVVFTADQACGVTLYARGEYD